MSRKNTKSVVKKNIVVDDTKKGIKHKNDIFIKNKLEEGKLDENSEDEKNEETENNDEIDEEEKEEDDLGDDKDEIDDEDKELDEEDDNNDNNDDNDDNDNDYDYDIDLYDENGNLIPPINYEEYDKMTENYYKNNAKFYSKYRIDIKCSINECNNKATYNFFNNHKPKFCNFHISKNMIKFGEYNKCKFENCLKYSSYNLSGYKYSLYCNTHKRDDMINVKSKRCLTQFCETIVNNDKYLNYCLYCFINIYPDIKINVRYKIKEHVVIDFIKQNFPNFTWLHNKQVQDGCSKKRPDLQVHLGFQVIIVEIDEDLIILIYI